MASVPAYSFFTYSERAIPAKLMGQRSPDGSYVEVGRGAKRSREVLSCRKGKEGIEREAKSMWVL